MTTMAEPQVARSSWFWAVLGTLVYASGIWFIFFASTRLPRAPFVAAMAIFMAFSSFTAGARMFSRIPGCERLSVLSDKFGAMAVGALCVAVMLGTF